MSIGLSFSSNINTSASNSSTITSASFTSVLGSVVYFAFSWGQSTVGAANTGDVNTISDTLGNTWHRAAATVYTPATIQGHYGLAVYYAIITTAGSTNITATITNGPYVTLKSTTTWWTNESGTGFDIAATGAIGTSNSATTNGVTPVVAYDALVAFTSQGASTQTMTASTGWNLRSNGTGGIGVQDFLFAGVGYSLGTAAGFITAPFSVSTGIAASVDWATLIVAVPTTPSMALAQGDIFEASAGYFQQIKENFFVGDLFLGGYTGLPWLKDVYMLSRDYWDKALSTPYSGQLFPVGPGEGGPGQIYPY